MFPLPALYASIPVRRTLLEHRTAICKDAFTAVLKKQMGLGKCGPQVKSFCKRISPEVDVDSDPWKKL